MLKGISIATELGLALGEAQHRPVYHHLGVGVHRGKPVEVRLTPWSQDQAARHEHVGDLIASR